jgi:hypothetical protein
MTLYGAPPARRKGRAGSVYRQAVRQDRLTLIQT